MKILKTKQLFLGSLWRVIDMAAPNFFTGGMGEMKKVMEFLDDLEEDLGDFAVTIKDLAKRTNEMTKLPMEQRQSVVNTINAEFEKLFNKAREEDIKVEFEDAHFNTLFDIFGSLDRRQTTLPFITWKEMIKFQRDLDDANANKTTK